MRQATCNPALAGKGPNAIRSTKTARVHRAARRRGNRVAARGIAYCCGAEFVGVNPCASFSDVECFNTKQLQLEPRRTLDRKVGGCGCGPRNTSA